MKSPIDIKPTTQNMMILGLIIFIIYLSQTGNLNQTTMLIIVGIIIYLIISGKGKLEMIDIIKAKEIALDYLISLQTSNEVPHGTIKVLPERELKSFLLTSESSGESGELISYGFHILSQISSTPISYFLVKIGIYGNIIGITQLLKKKSIGEIQDEITPIHATKISTTEEYKRLEEEKLKKGEDKSQ